MPPVVSVIMPVYNGEKYLNEALKSIQNQSFTDFEYIIIDDASTDSSHVILEKFAQSDSRVRLYNNETNLGLPKTLNRELEMAQGQYIARMDQDDISLPERLEKQVRYMQTHLEVGVCGSWVQLIGKRAGEIWKYPCTHDEIYARMLFENSVAHPSVIMRSSIILQHQLFYNTAATHIEDYDLWSRALPLVRFANIPEPLLQYRLHGANTDDLHADKQRKWRVLIYEGFLTQLDIKFTQDDLVLHESISSNKYVVDMTFLQYVRKWLEKIANVNEKTKLISSDALGAELGERWAQACQFSQIHPLSLYFEILNSPLRFHKSSGLLKLLSGAKFILGKAVFAKTQGLYRK